MNEQEKKTFNFLKEVYNLNFKSCTLENCDIRNIVNIIEIQQKEIEDLKAVTRTYEAYNVGEGDNIVIASKEWFDNGFFKDFLNDYISKDKIREKIDLIDKEYAEIIEKNKNDLYLVNINAQRHNAMQSILEELLGE